MFAKLHKWLKSNDIPARIFYLFIGIISLFLLVFIIEAIKPEPKEVKYDFSFRSIEQSGENAIIGILYYTGDIYGNGVKLEIGSGFVVYKGLASGTNSIILSGLYNTVNTSIVYKSKETLEQETKAKLEQERIRKEEQDKKAEELRQQEAKMERLRKEKEVKMANLKKKYEGLMKAGLYKYEITERLADQGFYMKSSDFATAPDGGTSIEQIFTKSFDTITVEISLQDAYDISHYYWDVKTY